MESPNVAALGSRWEDAELERVLHAFNATAFQE
jgi:hypothetical protein